MVTGMGRKFVLSLVGVGGYVVIALTDGMGERKKEREMNKK